MTARRTQLGLVAAAAGGAALLHNNRPTNFVGPAGARVTPSSPGTPSQVMGPGGSRATAVLAAAAGAAVGTAVFASRRAGAAPAASARLGAPAAASAASATARYATVTPEAMSSVTETISSLISQHDVVIFSKTTCPYCSKAKGVMEEEGIKFHVYEIDQLPAAEGALMQDKLAEMTGARTVPRIFVKGKCIGGCDNLVKIQEEQRLAEVFPGLQSLVNFKIKKSDSEWREQLGSEGFQILRRAGTERPGTHEFNRFMPSRGHFACAGCGLPLYSANSKFKSSCGWPVFKSCYFSKEAAGCHVSVKPDYGGLEILCKRCDGHLGHVFFDAFSATNPNGERH